MGKKCSFFRKIRRVLFSWNTRFDIRPLIICQNPKQIRIVCEFLRENNIKTGALHAIYLLHKANLKYIRSVMRTWTIARLTFLYRTFKRSYRCRLFLWGGTSSQFFGASSDYVSEPYVTNFIDLEWNFLLFRESCYSREKHPSLYQVKN